MRVYSYRTTENDFVYIRDGAVILIAYVDDSEASEWGMTAMGADILEVDEAGEATDEIEGDLVVSDLTDEKTAILCARILAFVNKNNL